jgi:hypothetical protein
MIDTDKYEGLTIDDWYKMNHHDWKDVVNEYNDLLAEVKKLRKGMKMMLDDMRFSKPEEDIEYWLDTWKHWLKEMIE